MRTRRCDRCGANIGGAVRYGLAQVWELDAGRRDPAQDLCLRCVEGLRVWLKGER